MLRILEPEVMDSVEAATEYDIMDFTEVNTNFAKEAIAVGSIEPSLVLDIGTGTARIPILICQMRPQWQIIASDLAENMLQIAAKNVQRIGLDRQIKLELADAKCLPYNNESFDLVISNSLVHHLPEPLVLFQEIKRVIKSNSGIFIRDLLRPANEEIMNGLVESIGEEYNEYQKNLFRDSLHAALTLDEVNEFIVQAGLAGVKVYQSSDRHWTVERSYVVPILLVQE